MGEPICRIDETAQNEREKSVKKELSFQNKK